MSTYIPFDIQLQIIQQQQQLLPIKSLIRFISVCKAWKSFITSSEFVAAYGYRHTQRKQHLMIKYETGEREVKYVCFVDDDDTFSQQKIAPTVPPIVQLLNKSTTIDSSCGLLCLKGFLPDTSKMEVVVLWNPSIGKSVVVGVPNRVRWPFNYVIGFGVCPHTNDPKLVRITFIDDWPKIESISCIPRQVEVFTLSYGGWKILSCSNLPRKSINFLCSQATIGQFIYWLAYDVTDRVDFHDTTPNMIMSFDMSTEEFREVDLPDSLTHHVYDERDLCISRLKESLALLKYDRVYPEKQVCSVWMMEHGDSKTFTKLFTINAPNASVRSIVGFKRSGEPIVEMEDDQQSALVVYEPCLEEIKDLGIRGNRDSFHGSSYLESLLLLDHDDGNIITC